jgi:hypothetical protein
VGRGPAADRENLRAAIGFALAAGDGDTAM